VSGICYRYKEFLTWKNQNKMFCTFSPAFCSLEQALENERAEAIIKTKNKGN